jgi:EAL domain-containing protein (putative c-di-GMP-specific phosphodiesterase class I)
MSAKHSSSGAPRRQGKVLLVDDDLDICREYARALRRSGLSVETATSAPEGLALLAVASFDVVLSDISMPAMSGVAFLRAVREHNLDLPVILMTGSPSVETAIKALDYGATKYLTKPVEPSELAEAVWRASDLHQLALLRRELSMAAETPSRQLADRAALDARFSKALESIWMAFQPIVSWSAKAPTGYEALLRSREPSLERPADLLDAAQRLNRLVEVGRVVRREVATAIASGPDCLTFVNLHPFDLNDDELLSSASPLSQFASRVVLEVTERAALDDVSGLSLKLAALKRMGYRIAIDDLGAGYAGLASFARLEPDFVKLDMSLIRDIDSSPRKRSLVKGVAQICTRDLAIQVICEGIERPEERDALVEDGLDLLQGYLFARPGAGFPAPSW